MIKKPHLTVVQTPEPPTLSRKDGLLILIAIMGILIVGISVSILINWFDLDNKVDVPNYPGSEKASLTAKGTTFIADKYTSDQPSGDYYKVRLTSDSCEKVLGYYRTEAAGLGWSGVKQGGSDGVNILVDSYKKGVKGLFIYCTPGSAQLAQNAGNKNVILLLTADSVLDLYPGAGFTTELSRLAWAGFSHRL